MRHRPEQVDGQDATDGDVVTWDATAGVAVWDAPTGGGGSYTDPLTTKGDLTGRDASATVRVPVGSNGTVLTADSSASPGVSWTTPTVTTPLVSIDDATLWGSDLGTDREFDANNTSSLPSGVAWVNQGTSTYLERFGAGTITPQIASGDNFRLLVWSLSGLGSTWSAVGKFSVIGDSADFILAGMVLRESSSGKFIAAHHWNLDRFEVAKWNSATAPTGGGQLVTPLRGVTGFNGGFFYVRIDKNSSSSWDVYASGDGCAWRKMLTANDFSTHLTPDQIGYGISPNNNTSSGLACHWLRVR